MDSDLLLCWMSETGEGYIRDLRRRIAWLARTSDTRTRPAATGRWIRDVSALGHAEASWERDRWAVAPSAIVRLPAADGTAAVAGSRRAGFLDRLEETGVLVHQVESRPAEGDLPVPTAILVQYDSIDALRQSALEVGAVYAGCAARRLALLLPPLSLGRPAPPPARGSSLQRLADIEPMAFEPARGDVDGLYRLRIHGRPEHLYRRDGDWYRCGLSRGAFLELARRNRSVMRWRPEGGRGRRGSGTLFVDWGAPLPLLHARALTLCSGLPPTFHKTARTGIYNNVPRDVAAAVASSLRQDLGIA